MQFSTACAGLGAEDQTASAVWFCPDANAKELPAPGLCLMCLPSHIPRRVFRGSARKALSPGGGGVLACRPAVPNGHQGDGRRGAAGHRACVRMEHGATELLRQIRPLFFILYSARGRGKPTTHPGGWCRVGGCWWLVVGGCCCQRLLAAAGSCRRLRAAGRRKGRWKSCSDSLQLAGHCHWHWHCHHCNIRQQAAQSAGHISPAS
jgi:hypothetical protein